MSWANFKKAIILVFICKIFITNIYPHDVNNFRDDIQKEIDSGSCVSATVAAIVDGETVYSEGFGIADRESEASVDKETVFNIGSISKVFLTVSIMQLVEEGKISLDGLVVNYLPKFRMKDKRYKKITVQMLLDHSSGLPGTQGRGAFNYRPYEKTHEILLENLAQAHLKHEPGKMNIYCNDGFTIAEMIVEKISGKKYIDYLREKIFSPLGLDHTGLSVGESQKNKIAKFYDNISRKDYPLEVVSVIGAGGLSSTAEDLCHFAQEFSNKESKLFKSSVSLSKMRTAFPSIFQQNFRRPSYVAGALGWDSINIPRYELNGVQVLMKAGGTLYYNSILYTVPEKSISVAVIASGGCSVDSIARTLLDSLLIKKGLVFKEEKEPSSSVVAETIPDQYKSFEGYYTHHNGASLLQFIFEGDKLNLYTGSGQNKKLASSFIYNNKSFYNINDNSKIYFADIDGEKYVMKTFESGKMQHDYPFAEKIKKIDHPQKLDVDLNGKKWLRRNLDLFEMSHFNPNIVESSLYDDLPGYVRFDGMKKIESPTFAGSASLSARDQTQLNVSRGQDGKIWVDMSGLLYSLADETPTLNNEKKLITINNQGHSEWLRVDKKQTLFINDLGAMRVRVFGPNKDQKYDSAIERKNTFHISLDSGSFIEIIGISGSELLVEGK